MLPRFHWSDITTVGHYLGVLILLTGVAMCVPALVAIVFGEVKQFGAFVVGIGFCALVGSALRFLKSRGLDRRRSLLLVGFSWIVIGFVAALPMFLAGSLSSLFDALFDSVSALTTTGVTLAGDIDCMSKSEITWRVILSFIGAQAVVVIALYTGFFGEGSTIFITHDRRSSTRTRPRPRISETWRSVVRVFGLFVIVGTVVVSIVCLTLGMNPIDAIMNGFWLATCAVSTSGFVPHTSDLIYYHSLPLQMALCVFMIAGALSFGIYSLIRVGRYKAIKRNSELGVYLLWIVLLVIFVTSIMTREGIFTSIGGFVQNGLVTVVSAATTCGMQTVYPEQMGNAISDGVVILVILAALFGACAYSTGGGIKIVRILQVLRWIKYSILVHLAPDTAYVRVKYEHYGSRELNSRDAMIAMTVMIMFIGSAALASMVFIASGKDALDSVFEVISYVSNCGMTTSITQEGLSFPLKVVALLLMWTGRVEFIALIAAVVGIILSLYPDNLFSNSRSRALRLLKRGNSGGTAWRKRKGQKNTKTMSVILVLALGAGLVLSGTPVRATQALAAQSGAQVPAQEISSETINAEYRQASIKELLSATTRLDKRGVSFEGEAMGMPLVADADHKWVNLKSDGVMIGVYMTNELASQITNYACYEHAGDIVSIQGEYHLACAQHNGELEVHADFLAIKSQGYQWQTERDDTIFIWGVLFLVGGIVLMFVRKSMRKKHSKHT